MLTGERTGGSFTSITPDRADISVRAAAPFLFLTLALGTSRAVIAQSTSPSPPAVADSQHMDVPPLLSRRQGALFAAAAAATVAVAPLDRRVRNEFQELAASRHATLLGHAAADLSFAGGAGPFIAGGALFAIGRTLRQEGTTDLGVHMTEGVLTAAALDGLLKGLTGRELPRASGGHPGEFSFGRGFHDGNGPYVSFPSGHTAAAFAAAAVLAAEAGRVDSTRERIVAPIAYGGATLVALSRLYEDVHWASDLPLGAAIGIWSGTTVVARGHSRRHDRVQRWLSATTLIPTSHRGLIVTWSADAP